MIIKSLLGNLSLIYLNAKKNIYQIYQNSSFYDKKISKIFKYHQANIYMEDSNVIPINSKNIKIQKR